MDEESSEVIQGARRAIYSGAPSALGEGLLAGLLAGLTRLAEMPSIEHSTNAGARIGRIWSRLRLPRTRRAQAQLREAFPEASQRDVDAWTSGVFEHFGRSLAELFLLRGRHRDRLLDRVEVKGFEHLTAAEKASDSGGVLVVSAHYGNWELAGMSIARRGIPLTAVFRGLDSPVLDHALLAIRRGDGTPPVDYEQIRVGSAGLGLVRALKAGRKVIVLLDQNARRDKGLFVRFFGRPACVRTGPIRLAMRMGIPILPAFIRRNPVGHGHQITIHPALPPGSAVRDRQGEDERLRQNLAKLTAVIEAEIRKNPAQWIWAHRRWRTQPDEKDAVALQSSCARAPDRTS